MKKKLEVGDKVVLIGRSFKDRPITGKIVAMVGERYVVYARACDTVCLFRENELEKYVKPVWVFTDAEKTILNNIDIKYKYIARNKNGTLCLYTAEPSKDEEYWWTSANNYCIDITFFNTLFNNIKWENSEACEFRKVIGG